MILLTAIVLIGHIQTASVTKVDFRLLAPQNRENLPDIVNAPPPDVARDSVGRNEAPATPRRPPAKSGNWSIARGFGDAVPLDFAAKQIVPPGLRVVYGPGVDRGQTTSWTGGAPWNRTLQDAIRPLGLRMTLTGQVVTLSK